MGSEEKREEEEGRVRGNELLREATCGTERSLAAGEAQGQGQRANPRRRRDREGGAPSPPAPRPRRREERAGRRPAGARCTSGGPGRLPAGGGVLRLAVVPGAARRGLPSSASAGLLSAAQRYGKKIDLCENFEVVQGEGF